MENDLRQGPDLMPCGHPPASIVIGEELADGQYVHYCGWCADLENGKAEIARLQEALKDAFSGSSDLWNKAMEAASHLYETWAKYGAGDGAGDGATETALEAFGQAWDEMLE